MNPQESARQAKYKPDVFDVKTIAEAKAIILTPEDGFSPEQRWQKETPILSEDVSKALNPTANSLIIDYGCGIGRVARELLIKHDGAIIGVDISKSMRALAHQYVEHPGFGSMGRNSLLEMVKHGLKADHAYAIWVLQHCAAPEDDINLIWNALKPGGTFMVVNVKHRVVPTNKGWSNDGKNITALLEERFESFEELDISQGAITEIARKVAECRIYKK
ncbi:MAG: class I SAM-dependent methyltransferase [Rhodospirillales bacterium]|nr:class I SAM-dependent methyltransferase [Rhodospirillales bacterium]